MGLSARFLVKIQFDPEHVENASITITVKTNSINTLNNKRDEHLRSPDFFDVEKFPEAKFKSTSWEHIEENRYRIKGILTLLGVDKPIELEAKWVGAGKGRNHEERIGFEAVFTIKRSDFGMTKYLPTQIGDEVVLTVGIEAEKNRKINISSLFLLTAVKKKNHRENTEPHGELDVKLDYSKHSLYHIKNSFPLNSYSPFLEDDKALPVKQYMSCYPQTKKCVTSPSPPSTASLLFLHSRHHPVSSQHTLNQ